jgi:hypothetical protein
MYKATTWFILSDSSDSGKKLIVTIKQTKRKMISIYIIILLFTNNYNFIYNAIVVEEIMCYSSPFGYTAT